MYSHRKTLFYDSKNRLIYGIVEYMFDLHRKLTHLRKKLLVNPKNMIYYLIIKKKSEVNYASWFRI